jgi:hypothetical protein
MSRSLAVPVSRRPRVRRHSCVPSSTLKASLRHAGFIENWITLLRDDSRAIFTAASQASRAADCPKTFSIASSEDVDLQCSEPSRQLPIGTTKSAGDEHLLLALSKTVAVTAVGHFHREWVLPIGCSTAREPIPTQPS